MESVTKCSKVKEWQGKPIYQVEMSNGVIGESFQDIPAGTTDDQLKFENTSGGKYPDRVKWNKPNTGGNGGGFNKGGSRGGNESFALAYAKDYAVAVIGSGKEFKGDAVIQLADVFYNWMEGKKK